jgi:hypothetical protein
MPSHDPTPPEDFETRRARWIAETQEMLQLLMERCGMQPAGESQTSPDTQRIMFVGTIGDRDRAVAAIMESGLARDVLVVGNDVPICRERDQATVTLRGYGRFSPVVLIEDTLSDLDAYVPVRLPERPKQTKRAWRRSVKGTQ